MVAKDTQMRVRNDLRQPRELLKNGLRILEDVEEVPRKMMTMMLMMK
jgi:hypothetical protein